MGLFFCNDTEIYNGDMRMKIEDIIIKKKEDIREERDNRYFNNEERTNMKEKIIFWKELIKIRVLMDADLIKAKQKLTSILNKIQDEIERR